MNQTIKELLEQIPFKPFLKNDNSITFRDKTGNYLEISAVDDETTYTMQYRVDYRYGNFEAGTVNFFDVEEKVTQFMV